MSATWLLSASRQLLVRIDREDKAILREARPRALAAAARVRRRRSSARRGHGSPLSAVVRAATALGADAAAANAAAPIAGPGHRRRRSAFVR
ncbi:hypothetical protein V9T40_000236 [Parthenolecanium corni]|uniref:Uncharacterized protein n=1 Tax=Parthenolecanium corni TaxID=536013 RepID=A0AAN9TM12_9HEMI